VAALRAGLCGILVKGTFSGEHVLREVEEARARKHAQAESESERSDEFKRDIIESVVQAIGDRVQNPIVQIDDTLAGTKAWVETAKWAGGIIGGIFIAGWVSYGVVSQYATKSYVDEQMAAHNIHRKDTVARIEALENQGREMKSSLKKIKDAQDRSEIHNEMLYYKDDYIERLLTWQLSGREGPKPQKSPRLTELEAKLVGGRR